MKKKLTDAHMHCFTLNHVPEFFFSSLSGGKWYLKISQIKNNSLSRFMIKLITSNLVILITKFLGMEASKQLVRLKGLMAYRKIETQKELLLIEDKIHTQKFPSTDFNYIALTMDMEYMGAGKSEKSYIDQLKELEEVKKLNEFKSKLEIFVHIDPRRIAISNDTFWEDTKIKLLHKEYTGIKIYPALGYYPFDINFKPVFEFALENNIPIMSHVVEGSVYQRDEKNINKNNHPITNQLFYGKSLSEYQVNFSHPLNYECLLNHELLKKFWGNDCVDLSKLKICLAHFGGDEEWLLHQKHEKDVKFKVLKDRNLLNVSIDWFGKDRNSWFDIIAALIIKYENTYTDISFTLFEDKIFNELQLMINKMDKISSRILYGTDYYVVSTNEKFSHLIKTLPFTENEMNQIANINVDTYLKR